MADEITTLSEDSIRLIQVLIDESRRKVVNTQNRPAVESVVIQASDIYIAHATNGVERRQGNAFGYAECALFRILPRTRTPVYIGSKHLVYNPYGLAVGAGAYVPVGKDKYGNWLVLGTVPPDESTWYIPGTGVGDSPGVTSKDSLDIVTNVCPIYTYIPAPPGSGTGTVPRLTGITVQKQRLFLPKDTKVGPAVCTVALVDCCASTGTGTGTGTETGTSPGTGGGGGGGDPVTVTCCPDPMPHTLHATISGSSGACPIINGTFALDFNDNEIAPAWLYVIPGSTGPITLYLICFNPDNWIFQLYCGTVGIGTFSTLSSTPGMSCSPVSIAFSGMLTSSGTCCFFGQTITVTVTE